MSEARAAGLIELGLPISDGAALGFRPSGCAAAWRLALTASTAAKTRGKASCLVTLHPYRAGGWSLVGPFQEHATIENRCSATAMALLAFQGFGVKHTPDTSVSPDYHDVVARGWKFLLNMQNKDGFFVHEGGQQQRLYAQAQATIALCEIYGMTRDPALKKPAQLALDFAHKAQSPELGVTSVKVIGPSNATVALAPLAKRDSAAVVAAVKGAMAAGAYTVAWRTMAKDGHVARGTFAFTVGTAR